MQLILVLSLLALVSTTVLFLLIQLGKIERPMALIGSGLLFIGATGALVMAATQQSDAQPIPQYRHHR